MTFPDDDGAREATVVKPSADGKTESHSFVMGHGRLIFDEQPWSMTNNLPEVSRWGESDADPLADIEQYLSLIRDQKQRLKELRALITDGEVFILADENTRIVVPPEMLATLMHESGSTVLELDRRGGSLPGTSVIGHAMMKRHAKETPEIGGYDYQKHNKTRKRR